MVPSSSLQHPAAAVPPARTPPGLAPRGYEGATARAGRRAWPRGAPACGVPPEGTRWAGLCPSLARRGQVQSRARQKGRSAPTVGIEFVCSGS